MCDRTATSYECASAGRKRAECSGPSCITRRPGRPVFPPHPLPKPVFDPIHTPWAMPSRNSSFPFAPAHSGTVSWNSTSTSPSPTPTPRPHCSGAPRALVHNAACHDIARACSCLGKLSLTSTVTQTETVTAVAVTVITENLTTVVTSTSTNTIIVSTSS